MWPSMWRLPLEGWERKRIDIFCLERPRAKCPHIRGRSPWPKRKAYSLTISGPPKKVLGEGPAVGLGLRRCTSVFDNACNFNPVYDDEITHRAEADTVILAIGQSPVLDFLGAESEVKIKVARIVAEEVSLTTGEPGIFAGGDIVTGPASIINGIAQGRQAAAAIDRFLGGIGDISETLASPEDSVVIPDFAVTVEPRNDLPHLKLWERALGFDQIELPITA